MFVILGADGKHKRIIVNLDLISHIVSDSFIGKKSGTVFLSNGVSITISDTQMKTLMDSIGDIRGSGDERIPWVGDEVSPNDMPVVHNTPKTVYGEEKYLKPKWITFHVETDKQTRLPEVDMMLWDEEPIGVPCYKLRIPIPKEVLITRGEILKGSVEGPFDNIDNS